MRILAAIRSPAAIRAILECLGEPGLAPRSADTVRGCTLSVGIHLGLFDEDGARGASDNCPGVPNPILVRLLSTLRFAEAGDVYPRCCLDKGPCELPVNR